MVAKKTAVQQSASGTAASAEEPREGAKTAARARTGKRAAGKTGKAGKAATKQSAGKTGSAKAAAGKSAAEKAGAGKAKAGKAAAAKPAGGASAARKGASEAAAGKSPQRRTAAARKGGTDAGTTRTSGGTQDTAGHGTATDADAAEAAPQTGATTVGAEKTPGTATAAKSAVPKARIAAVEPGDLAVRPGEDPWTPEEVEGARAELMTEVLRLREEITSSERSLAGLMRDSGDGAGDDQADTGTKNITREHELALAANAREMLTQYERALQRLDAGTYGLCENCGDPIGKARMQAFPRATLCVECKQKQERRY
ncbi:TraR/DksA family transcriptional regulator [Streptomyces sp. NEAU-W12]|uniref:TraR/DksA family transcriptional regulator n=1 Tax=Streptomyces sp. NEAU-W12 TaxID=2994668 RepID=UPI00224AF164|nr:TraR/DksA family transcriptional regulator [Streptomyces sp. NEAU-W12]MCX2922565.1 TraR/DksA family transcriptional regulator [Streptomyces sp. NEAU-W12]